jgi:hypothetical protein
MCQSVMPIDGLDPSVTQARNLTLLSMIIVESGDERSPKADILQFKDRNLVVDRAWCFKVCCRVVFCASGMPTMSPNGMSLSPRQPRSSRIVDSDQFNGWRIELSVDDAAS